MATDFIMQCPTVPVVRGSEMRLSVDFSNTRIVSGWPLAPVSCGELTPSQPRIQWGHATAGHRVDAFQGLRLGTNKWNVTYGRRSTHTGEESRFKKVEDQHVGVLSLTMGGMLRFKYWNDHHQWWWPIAPDGGDQGDTAGIQIGYNLAPHNISLGSWRFQQMNLTLRLATGIPNRAKIRETSFGSVYTEVAFPEIQRGDIDVSTQLKSGQGGRIRRIEVGFTVDTDDAGHATQNLVAHRPNDIPEFSKYSKTEVMVYLRLIGF